MNAEHETKAMQKMYLSLMEEACMRIDSLNAAYLNMPQLPPLIVKETCFLQLRFLCEIVALACLVAHGDIQSSRLRKTYEPSKIINEMQRLKPHFYPQPMDIEVSQGLTRLVARNERVHLTKKDLAALWGRSGDVLHRAPLAKFIRSQDEDHTDLSEVLTWGEKLGGLLNCHWITLADNKRGMVVVLKSAETGKPSTTVLNFTFQQEAQTLRF